MYETGRLLNKVFYRTRYVCHLCLFTRYLIVSGAFHPSLIETLYSWNNIALRLLDRYLVVPECLVINTQTAVTVSTTISLTADYNQRQSLETVVAISAVKLTLSCRLIDILTCPQ